MGESFDLPDSLGLTDQRGQSYPSLVALMQRLLAPDGCPWDREQSFESLRRYVLEEACEVIDAVDSGDPAALKDEKVREYREKFANPYAAAERGYIDEVIEPRDTRRRLIQALEVLHTKRDVNPPKKHGNIPL